MIQNFTRMAALITGHPVQKLIAIHFHPYNPVLLPQNIYSILFCGIFLSNLFVYLVAIWQHSMEMRKQNVYDQP